MQKFTDTLSLSVFTWSILYNILKRRRTVLKASIRSQYLQHYCYSTALFSPTEALVLGTAPAQREPARAGYEMPLGGLRIVSKGLRELSWMGGGVLPQTPLGGFFEPTGSQAYLSAKVVEPVGYLVYLLLLSTIIQVVLCEIAGFEVLYGSRHLF